MDLSPSAGSSVSTDEELVQLVRRGVTLAYVALYERHVGTARRVARSIVHNAADAEDAVSEAFASVLSAIQKGKGPHDAFSGYLISCVRHECYRSNRRSGVIGAADTPMVDAVGGDPSGEIDPFARRDDAELLRHAFRSLPPTWREVLWRTEVEGLSHQAIAGMTKTSAPAVAAQAMRARRALAAAYLHGHVDLIDGGSTECVRARRHLADLVRGRVGSRRRRGLEGHLDACASCRQARDELLRLNQRLRAVWPLALTRGGLSTLLDTGITARVLEWVPSSVPSVVAATGLIVGAVVGPATPITDSETSPHALALDVAVVETPPPSTHAVLVVVPTWIERRAPSSVPAVATVPADTTPPTTTAPPVAVETAPMTTVDVLLSVSDHDTGQPDVATGTSVSTSTEAVAEQPDESVPAPSPPVTSPAESEPAPPEQQTAELPEPDPQLQGPSEHPTHPTHPEHPTHPTHPEHPTHPTQPERASERGG